MKKRIKHSTGIWILATLFTVLSAAPSVYARGNIRLGKLKVAPEITYKGEYNDNIFLAKDDAKDDIIHLVEPSLLFEYAGSSGVSVSAGYRFKSAFYTDYSDSNYTSHNPFLSFGWESPFGLYVGAEESFFVTSDPYGSENQYKEGQKTRRMTNTAKIKVGYKFSDRYSIETGWQNYILNYDADVDKWQNRTDNKFDTTFSYRITGKTALIAQYRYTQAEYGEQNDGVDNWTDNTSQDYSLNDFLMGARFAPGGKLTGEVKVGYGQKKFKNDVDRNGKSYGDSDSWLVETDLGYKPGHRTKIAAKVKRSFQGAPDADSSSFLDTYADLELKQGITERFGFNVGLGLSHNDYLDSDKLYYIYSARAGLDWQILKWLRGGLAYNFKSKDASDTLYEGDEYDSNVFSMQLDGLF